MLLEIGREGEAGKPVDWSGEQPLVIGRGRQADMMIQDALLSRKHCQLEKRGDAIYIVDLGSANGTFLNGIQVTRSELQGGDIVSFGKSWLRVVPELVKVAVGGGGTDESTRRVNPRTAQTQKERKIPVPGSPFDPSFPEIEGYQFIESIGKGSFGTVYRTKHIATGRECAIKVIPTGPTA